MLDKGTGQKWHWHSIMADLAVQGVPDVVIHPESVTNNGGCNGNLNDNRFTVTWVKDKFFMLSMATYSEELVQGFARVLEYQPFCRYQLSEKVVSVEWSKVDADERFAELQKMVRRDLQHLLVPS